MVVPNIFAKLSHPLVLYLVYRKDIPTSYTLDHIKAPESTIRDHKMFKRSWVILTVLLAGYLAAECIGDPVSFVAGIVALIFFLMGWSSEGATARRVVRK